MCMGKIKYVSTIRNKSSVQIRAIKKVFSAKEGVKLGIEKGIELVQLLERPS